MYCCVYACAQARAHTFASDWHREIIWTPTDQPMERGAHTVASERARWTSQTVAPQPDEHTRTADRSKPAFSTHECPPSVCPSLHHLLLPFTLFAVLAACALRVRPPSLIGQRADRMGTMGGGAGALSPTACEKEAVSCRDSALTTDSVVAIGTQRLAYWLINISAAVVPCASSSSSSSLHLEPMEGCRDVVHKEN